MSFWGRIICGTAGFALGGQIGGILGVDEDNITSKKWKELNKKHHSYNLTTKGKPKEFINLAIDECASINLTYDKIKEIRENI